MPDGNDYNWTFTRDAPINTARYEMVDSPVKFCILDLCGGLAPLDYKDLASILDMPTDYAADRLVKLARRGYLERTRDGDGGRSTFELSDRGWERLQHFREQG